MKKNIIIIIAVILGAILFRYGATIFDKMMQGKAAKSKPAPSVTVETVKDANIIRSF